MTALAGLALGALAWLAAGRQDTLASLQDRISALGPIRAAEAGVSAPVPSGAPLFALSTGPYAVKDPAVAVLGVSRMPGRSAALLSIDGKPAAWLARGDSRDGVVLRDVGGGRATLDLPLGVRDLKIGEGIASASAPGGAAAAGPGAPTFGASDVPPSGFRSPPPPASAPGSVG